MDIEQWKQQLDQACNAVIACFEDLYANVHPEVAGTLVCEAMETFGADMEQRCVSGGTSWFMVAGEEPAPKIRETLDVTARDIVDVGDQTWVEPLAIVEDTVTGEYFVDPLFSISDLPTEHHRIELVMTEAGLAAAGPANLHRLRREVNRERFRPLVSFEVITV